MGSVQHAPRGSSRRRAAVTGAAVVLVWLALVAPHRVEELRPAVLLRVPLELIVLAAALLVLPRRAHRAVAAAAGVALALVCVLKLLDLGFRVAFDRPFNPLTDTGYAGSAWGLLTDSVGTPTAVLVLAGLALLVVGLLVGLPAATLRLGTAVRRRRRGSARALAALLAAWLLLAATGAATGAGPVASATSTTLALDQERQVRATLRDDRQFAEELQEDPLATPPPRQKRLRPLSGLRGKDVLVVFVESYGRVALEGPDSAPVREVLRDGGARLARAGFGARSAYLTSPVSGGASWLAHATLQSGLWVDNERRYDRLLGSRRTTLMGLFAREGWRTVMQIPSSDPPWPEGRRLYRFEVMYGAEDVGYEGPVFGYARVPDQYTLEALHRLELSRDRRRPVMAEVDLVSSHTPWAPTPWMLPWEEVRDPAAYEEMRWAVPDQADVWGDTAAVRAAYADSVAYSLEALLGFAERYADDDTVLVVLGDHQPAAVVTGPGADRDVPVTVLARDRRVLDRVAGWGWRPGLQPGGDAPVWRMDSFRDRFLAAFDTPLPRTGAAPGVRRKQVLP